MTAPIGTSVWSSMTVGSASPAPVTAITKRDGRVVPFDPNKIDSAISRCFASVGREPVISTANLTSRVVMAVAGRAWSTGQAPSVEDVQDIVEMVLQSAGEFEAAKHYILYREEHAKARAERPIPTEVAEAFAASKTYFPTPLQEFQFYDKYSRFDYGLGRRETWVETVDRTVAQLYRLAAPYADLGSEFYDDIRRGILEMRAMPSMRLLAMAGPAFERDHTVLYNCSYLPVADLRAFGEAMHLSMAGCGVGFSVERQYIERFPRVARQRPTTTPPPTWFVVDSAQGWVNALMHGLETWMSGGDTAFDFSQVRRAGSVLRTKGGRASGPEPLKTLLDFCRSRILSRQGSFLRTIDAHDIMCAVGNAVVSGGVRRTAMISLFDADDANMLTAKQGDFATTDPQRWNANNSMVWANAGAMSQEEFIARFMEMVKSGRGEPGIFSRDAAISRKPDRRVAVEFGTNPCFTGDTKVWTIYGPRRFDELVGREVPVLTQLDDGSLAFRPMTNICLTRKSAPVYKVTLRNNYGQVRRRSRPKTGSFTATGDHIVFLRDGSEARVADLTAGDRLASVYRGRANSKGYLKLTNGHESDMEHRIVAAYAHGSKPAYPDFHVDHINGVKWDNDPDNLQVMPASEHNALNMRGDDNPVRRMPDRNHFRWDRYETAGFTGRRHTDKTRRQMSESHKKRVVNHEVVSVELAGRADVYDGTVEGTHKFFIETELDGGVLVHNCGEIVLRPYGLCNLSIAVARHDDTTDSLAEKVKLAAQIGTIQSLATSFSYLRPEWRQNCEDERLLGVDITGQRDCPLLQGTFGSVVLSGLRNVARGTNAELAVRLGINRSAAVTTVKPSGNSSQLLNCSSGLHARWAPYYIRNVRVSASSAIARVLKDAGVPMNPENGDDPVDPRTWVVSFPVKAPEGSVTRNDLSAVDQCKWWLRNKLNWTEHNPSVTITYRPDEIMDLMKWVWDHRETIGGMAFLPAFDAKYDQLPYIEITEEEYERRVAEFPEIDFSKIYRYEAEDFTAATQLSACDGPTCEIDL